MPLMAFPHDGETLIDVRFHPGGNYLLVISLDGPRVWNLETEERWAIPGDGAFDAAKPPVLSAPWATA